MKLLLLMKHLFGIHPRITRRNGMMTREEAIAAMLLGKKITHEGMNGGYAFYSREGTRLSGMFKYQSAKYTGTEELSSAIQYTSGYTIWEAPKKLVGFKHLNGTVNLVQEGTSDFALFSSHRDYTRISAEELKRQLA